MIRLELVEEVEDLDVGKGSSVGIDNVDRHNLPRDYHPFHPFPPTFSSFLSIPTHNEPRWVTPPVMVKKMSLIPPRPTPALNPPFRQPYPDTQPAPNYTQRSQQSSQLATHSKLVSPVNSCSNILHSSIPGRRNNRNNPRTLQIPSH